MDTLKIFISSPGDVEIERTLAANVINLLKVEFDGRAVLEAILWEREVLLATATFQDQLDLPSNCDIAVFVLGDRFGTPLPASYQREDGSRYLSGTEFEFEDAIAGFRKNGSPQILVYKKSRRQYVKLDDSNLDEILKQKRDLETFIDKWFLRDDDATFSGAFYMFNSSDEFEQMCETHLYKLVSQLVEGRSHTQGGRPKQWIRGNPYLGLNSFRYEHAPIYFGRTKAISECIDLLHVGDEAECPFLLILGMSGGGKSSLAHAGIVPMVIRRGVDRGINVNQWATIRPVEQRGSLLFRLVSAVVSELTEPENLESELQGQRIIESVTSAGEEVLANSLVSLLQRDRKSDRERVVLVVDQFEELFTSSSISNIEAKAFVALLDRLARKASVWCICTLRSDFYPEFTKNNTLVALKNDGAQFDLPLPTEAELSLMIRGPAIAAGLHFEKDVQTGISLDEKIRNIAETNPEILPLLEYTLAELYEHRDAEGWLTNQAYLDLGGVEGALAKSAERCFASLSRPQRTCLPIVFNMIFDFSPDGGSGRRWANVEEIENQDARAFLTAFVNARLFVMELDNNQRQIVTVTHESLFRYWPRLCNWLENNKDQLRVRSRINSASELWVQQGQSNDLLLGRGKPAEEARLLLGSGLGLTDTAHKFIETSLARVQLNRRIRYAGFTLVFVFAVLAGVAAYLATVSSQNALRRLAQNDDLISFMLDDLMEQLRPIGRLEPIRIVGEKAIDYFDSIEDEDRTDIARIKHAQALRQVGQIYSEAGEFGVATQAFAESLRQSKILFELKPIDSRREFELGQAYYWVAYSNLDQGRLAEAEHYFLLYYEVAQSLALKDPQNVEWQMELGYAHQNLGALEERRYQSEKALVYFESATQIFSGLAEAHPGSSYIARELAENYSWLGTNYRDMGDLEQSLNYFQREEEITRRLVDKNDDAHWRYSMMHVHRHLGELYIDSGLLTDARDQFEQGLAIVDELVAGDNQNIDWMYGKALCHFYLAQISIYLEEDPAATRALDDAAAAISRLQDSHNINWRILEFRNQLLATIHGAGEGAEIIELIHAISENINALLTENPDSLQLRRLAVKANLALAARTGDRGERNKVLAMASAHINNQMLKSNRPDVLITILMFYAYSEGKDEQLASYREKLGRYGIRHPEINRILSVEF